jgi:hypothetical protein
MCIHQFRLYENSVDMLVFHAAVVYLILNVNINVCSEIIVDKFKKQNCRCGVSPMDGVGVVIKTRSRLKCAAKCARQMCKSYRYDRTTGTCYMSTSMIDDDSGAWYCVPCSRKFLFC